MHNHNNPCGIYKITSPSNKIYIGQSKNISKRKVAYKNPNNIKEQTKIYRSIIKYGWEAHTFEIIEECSEEDLNKRERFWQEFYDVLGEKGLNCFLTNTEEKKRVFTEEECKKRSERIKGEKNYNWINRGINHPCRGLKYSKERIESITGGNSHRAILVLNINTGIFYDTIKEACNTTNLKYYTFLAQISGVCNNKTGFIKV